VLQAAINVPPSARNINKQIISPRCYSGNINTRDMKNIAIKCKGALLLLFIAVALLPATGLAQKGKKAEIKNVVEAKSYVFVPQTALPSGGRSRQLTGDFDLRVSKDTIISNLPYFGRAYIPPANPSEGPLYFTSTQFEYTVTNNKKGGWDIVITPKDLHDQRQIALSIFDNGRASATVTSNNRQPIAFNGYIAAKR
jgi:hypothetical protein